MPDRFTPPTVFDRRNLLASLFAATGPIIDGGTGARVGTTCWCLGRSFAAANADTSFTHSLGRTPTGVWMVRNGPGGIVYDATDGAARWTASVVWLRATVLGTYGFVLM